MHGVSLDNILAAFSWNSSSNLELTTSLQRAQKPKTGLCRQPE